MAGARSYIGATLKSWALLAALAADALLLSSLAGLDIAAMLRDSRRRFLHLRTKGMRMPRD